uniref:Membrane protein family member, putative n=1 Tax=Theileria annulata TaxID=5874 RepID=A0A3B0N707_THEAN
MLKRKINLKLVQKAAMFMAGFTLYQCLRIALTASSFALKRFSIPRRNVDIFITKIHNAMEVAIFLGILLMTLYILFTPRKYAHYNNVISVITNWLVCSLYFVVLYAYAGNGKMGHLTIYYWGLVLSGFAMGLNQSIVMSVSVDNISFFAGAIPFAGVQVSVYHILFLKFNRGRENYDVEYWILVYQIIFAIIISAVAATLWTVGFLGEFTSKRRRNSLIDNTEIPAIVIAGSDQSSAQNDKNMDKLNKNDSGSDIYSEMDSDVRLGQKGLKDLERRSKRVYIRDLTRRLSRSLSFFVDLSFYKSVCNAASPILMSTIAMGLVYLVFPAIAPYRFTDLVTAHRIDVSILITFIAPALINIILCAYHIGPNCDWSLNKHWHFVWLFAIPYFICIILFFVPIHYPESTFGKLMTGNTSVLATVCFTFSLSHAILKTVGFTGAGVQSTTIPNPTIVNNTDISFGPKGPGLSEKEVKIAMQNCKKDRSRNGQVSSFNILLSYFFLVVFAFLGDGYIKTIKLFERNRDFWPTYDMGFFASTAFWIKKSFKRGLRSFGEVFTLDVRDQLMT